MGSLMKEVHLLHLKLATPAIFIFYKKYIYTDTEAGTNSFQCIK